MATEETKVHLLPTDPAQDRVLEEFLNKFKHKSAIDHIEKRLKKARSEHVVRLTVMRALITIQRDQLAYFNQDPAEYLAPSITALADIAPQTVTDLACLEAVDEIGRGSWIGQYWQKAAELHADHEDVFDIWFDTQFRKQQYDEAAKAVVSWRKYFPSKAPELSWRLILCYHLATTSHHVGERQKSMCGMLRDKLIEQAVDNTPSRNEKLPTLRCQLDLELVCDIYRTTRNHQRALDILDDDSKGLRSPFGSWALARMKLDSLLALEKADELRIFATEILEDAVNPDEEAHKQHWGFGDAGDDFHVVRTMVMIARPDDRNKTIALLKALTTAGSLNGYIGITLYHCKHNSGQAAREAVQRFWTKFAPLGKAVDLQLLEHLPREERATLVTYTDAFRVEQSDPPTDTAKQTPCVNSIVQSYQLRFLWFAAGPEHFQEAEAAVCELLSLWKLSIQSEAKKPAADNGSGDEAMILAARMCLHLFRVAPERYPNALSHARLVLEILVQFSKHNYRALILLIRICLYQGAATKAMIYYRRLDIKNLQFITEAACMLQNLSVLHPFPVLAGSYNPWGELLKMRQWIAKRYRTYDNFVVENLEEGNWSGVIDQLDTKSKAFWSTSVALVNMEVCRIAAKTNATVDQEVVAAAETSLDQIAPFVKLDSMTANGESQTMILDRIGQEFPERIHEVLHLGASADYSEFATRFWDVACSNKIRRILRQLPTRPSLKVESTATSHIIGTIWTYFTCISNTNSTTTDIEATLSQIDGWLESTSSTLPIAPIAEQPFAIHSAAGPHLIRAHGILDILRLLNEVLEWARREKPASATRTKATIDKVTSYQENMRRFAEDWMESFGRDEKAGSRARSDLENALLSIMGGDAVTRANKEFSDSVRASVACLAKVAS